MYSRHYLAFIEHFNRGEYRACVEPLEELWFAQRDDFHKGLIRLVVGLHQIGLGLDSGPRFLLSTARELLRPYHPWHNGLDLLALDAWIAQQERLLDQPNAPRQPSPFVLRIDPPPDYV
jgi:predicted metal-dependent hydrolase